MDAIPMRLTEFAHSYCRERGIRLTPVYSANRFARVIGDFEVDAIQQDQVDAFIKAARIAGYKEETIRGTVKDLRTLVSAAGQKTLSVNVKKTQPKPTPTPMEHIEAIIPHLAPWSLQWLVLAYWTALRLADTIALQKQLAPVPMLQWQASKTKWWQSWPVPKWMAQYLHPVSLPYQTCPDWAQAIVREELTRVSNAAGIPQIYPKHIRQRSLTEWLAADFSAGQIIHGCGLKILDHYVSQVSVLENAMHKVKIPRGLKDQDDSSEEETLILNFRRLDPQAKDLVVHTTQRLAGA